MNGCDYNCTFRDTVCCVRAQPMGDDDKPFACIEPGCGNVSIYNVFNSDAISNFDGDYDGHGDVMSESTLKIYFTATIFTARRRSCRKVMFSVVSVCQLSILSTRRGSPVYRAPAFFLYRAPAPALGPICTWLGPCSRQPPEMLIVRETAQYSIIQALS